MGPGRAERARRGRRPGHRGPGRDRGDRALGEGARCPGLEEEATGSPPSPPTRNAASSRTWNCATAGGPAARTGSAARRTPSCGTCRSRASPRTSCGARSSPWPASCWPGPSCPPWPGRPAAGNRNGSASPVLRRRAPRPQRPPATAPPRRTLALGHGHHRRHQPPASHPVRLTSRNSPPIRKEQTPGPVEPRPPGATAGQPGISRTGKSTSAEHPQASRSRIRKVRATGGRISPCNSRRTKCLQCVRSALSSTSASPVLSG